MRSSRNLLTPFLVIAFLCFTSSNTFAQQPTITKEDRKQLLKSVQEALKNQDDFAAARIIETLTSDAPESSAKTEEKAKPADSKPTDANAKVTATDTVASPAPGLSPVETAKIVAKRYFYLVIDSYSVKDVDTMVRMGRLGIHYMLIQARVHAEDVKARAMFRSLAQMTSFNLSMNTWVGWNDKGIVLRPSDQQFGLLMAKLDQRLVLEDKLPPKKQATATWAIAIHQMVLGDHAAAAKTFERVNEYAKKEKNPTNTLMYLGYATINEMLRQKIESREELDKVIAELKKLDNDDARYYEKQLSEVYTYLKRHMAPAQSTAQKSAAPAKPQKS